MTPLPPVPAHLAQYPWYAPHLAWLVSQGRTVPHAPGEVAPARANLTRANLTRAYLNGAYLNGADLTGADLTGAYLNGADLTGADLTGAYLTGAYLTGAYLTGANLTGATLTFATLTGANLTGATLTGATLTYANLTGATLTYANLTRATLTYANLTGATLTGTCLDPAATFEPPSVEVLTAEGMEVKGGWVYAVRTKVSQHAGSTVYTPGEYVAPWFSVAPTDCHPGLYVAGPAWLAREYGGKETVRVRFRRADCLQAGGKFRVRRFWVLS